MSTYSDAINIAMTMHMLEKYGINLNDIIANIGPIDVTNFSHTIITYLSNYKAINYSVNKL